MAHGHDVHFLERLERLSTPETELALSLYQDPLLIQALLEQIRLLETAARVALSLGVGIALRHRGAAAEVRKALTRENRAAAEGCLAL